MTIMVKPKSIDEWGLCKKSTKKVKKELKKWLQLFLEQSQGRSGNVYRADFLNQDFFFFTDCKDILSKDPEGTGQEVNLEIRKRKRNVFNQLFVKTLLGEKLGKKIKCSRCGYDEVYINGFNGGHFTYCRKCQKTDICTYPDYYGTCIDEIEKQLIKKFPSDFL